MWLSSYSWAGQYVYLDRDEIHAKAVQENGRKTEPYNIRYTDIKSAVSIDLVIQEDELRYLSLNRQKNNKEMLRQDVTTLDIEYYD